MAKNRYNETSSEAEGEEKKPLQKFFFSTKNRVIHAASLKEAIEKLGEKEDK